MQRKPLTGFGIRVMLASYNVFGSLPSSEIFWKGLSWIDGSFYLNFWQNSTVSPTFPGLLFVGRFLITVSISMLVMVLLRFSIFPGSLLESYTFLRICPFLPHCPFYWHIVADSSLLWSFVFLCCLLWFLHFILNFADLILLCLFSFSWWVWLMICLFYLSSQRTSF